MKKGPMEIEILLLIPRRDMMGALARDMEMHRMAPPAIGPMMGPGMAPGMGPTMAPGMQMQFAPQPQTFMPRGMFPQPFGGGYYPQSKAMGPGFAKYGTPPTGGYFMK